jgi:hypothetical protein
MYRALQRTRLFPFCTLLILAGSLALSVVSQLHDLSDDELSGPPLVIHDESAHRTTDRINTSRSAKPYDQHCFICHWLQSLRTIEATVTAVSPSQQWRRFEPDVTHLATFAALQEIAARAPPLA